MLEGAMLSGRNAGPADPLLPSTDTHLSSPAVQQKLGGADVQLPTAEPHCKATCVTISAYGALNITSSVLIVIANKMVLQTYGFAFPAALTLLHMVFTAAGMTCMALAGVFTPKSLSWRDTWPVGAAFAASVALGNISLQLNSVGFYQLTKLLVPPLVMSIEYLLYHAPMNAKVVASILVLIIGGMMAATADQQLMSNPVGAVVALTSVAASALYQVWAGGKQKELCVNGMQLLQHVSLTSAATLGILGPLLEPWGWEDTPDTGTLLGYQWTRPATVAMVGSCLLGLLVTLSMFLFIGATSPLTFNVMGHAKTVLIIIFGAVVFQEDMAPQKVFGTACAMSGIMWYSWLRFK
jgi:solute carrier family 35 protein E3